MLSSVVERIRSRNKNGAGDAGTRKIAIVGNPNVGKSVLFNALTGRYATVSNYPGTTVEVSRGEIDLSGARFEVVDTPGMYSLFPVTEEERVARQILFEEDCAAIVHVVDAKNCEYMLPLTLKLIETGMPLVVVLNIMDEARREGLAIDGELLAGRLGVPVVGMVSTEGEGVDELLRVLGRITEKEYAPQGAIVRYDARVEEALRDIEKHLDGECLVSKRAIAAALLAEDGDAGGLIAGDGDIARDEVAAIIDAVSSAIGRPVEYEMALTLKSASDDVLRGVIADSGAARGGFRAKLDRVLMRPLTGLPILFVVLYLGLYKFVGDFGAGTVVGLLEEDLFEGIINPFFTRVANAALSSAVLRDLFVGEYGVLTLGLRYAVALILPIVSFFFVVFSVIEDSGYLPRLSMLLDRSFKRIGLSGRAVIPMVLGFGCDTMATMVTRTLPTLRERIIATALLALAVPCSAQLGVILALLAGRPRAALVWVITIVAVFIFIGYLASKLMPGEKPVFYMEVPPLRVPKLSNVVMKTYSRVKWYFKEILPLFIFASVIIWLGRISGLFDAAVNLLKKPVAMIGLPHETASVFLFGFFRRDYGAAGLYDIAQKGMLNETQLAVACVALTLFLPCIAQFLMNVRERGWKAGLALSLFIVFFSFTVAFALNRILVMIGGMI